MKLIARTTLLMAALALTPLAHASTYTFGTGYPHSVTGPSGNTVNFGWKTPAVSEAGTLSMMAAGLGLIGLQLRRKKS